MCKQTAAKYIFTYIFTTSSYVYSTSLAYTYKHTYIRKYIECNVPVSILVFQMRCTSVTHSPATLIYRCLCAHFSRLLLNLRQWFAITNNIWWHFATYIFTDYKYTYTHLLHMYMYLWDLCNYFSPKQSTTH